MSIYNHFIFVCKAPAAHLAFDFRSSVLGCCQSFSTRKMTLKMGWVKVFLGKLEGWPKTKPRRFTFFFSLLIVLERPSKRRPFVEAGLEEPFGFYLSTHNKTVEPKEDGVIQNPTTKCLAETEKEQETTQQGIQICLKNTWCLMKLS